MLSNAWFLETTHVIPELHLDQFLELSIRTNMPTDRQIDSLCSIMLSIAVAH